MSESKDPPVVRVKLPTGFNVKIEFVDPPDVEGQDQDDWLRKLGLEQYADNFWDKGCNSGCNGSC